jgi:hypothetical protein
MKQKKYYVLYKWVEIEPGKIKSVDVRTGKYNLSYNEMLSNGGTVIWQGRTIVEVYNEGQIFALSRYQATKDFNNTLLGGSVVQDPNKTTYFVITDVKMMNVGGGKVNAIGSSDNGNKSTNILSFKNIAIVGILVIGAIYLLKKQKK